MSDLHVEFYPGKDAYRLTKPLQYYSCLAGQLIEVPENFCTDFASVPRSPCVFSMFGDRAEYPGVIHDYCYRRAKFSRYTSDGIFYEAMLTKGMDGFSATIMYYAVRLFGRDSYNHKLSTRRSYYE